jgi:MFS transporter, FSR family, fosmidomycin resistance protein
LQATNPTNLTTPESALGSPPVTAAMEGVAFRVLAALSLCHLINDSLQSVIPAVYPILKTSYHLDFVQIGLITFTSQLTASLLQPVIGFFTDHKPQPFSLSIGMGFTLCGLVALSMASSFPTILMAVALVGIGSAVFHPESSRVARMASGGQHGLAQSLFQVGGNAGTALGPLLAAFIVLPKGQGSIAWFTSLALVGILLLARIGVWYRDRRAHLKKLPKAAKAVPPVAAKHVGMAMAVLVALIFSKFFYMASLGSYYTFYLISKFHSPVQSAQIHLFVFLGSVAAGTIAGGPIGDRLGRKRVIWFSILGPLPFTLMLPYANLFWTGILTVPIGLLLASAFPAIVVYAQELVPGKIGTVSGLFFGLAFGMGGIGAAVLGKIADAKGIEFVYQLCAFLPAIGLLAAFLPNTGHKPMAKAAA